MSLTTLATLKTDYLDGLKNSTAADATLQRYLNAAEVTCARWCGWPVVAGAVVPVFTSQTYTFFLNGPTHRDRAVLQLPHPHVTAITSIHEDLLWNYDDGTLVDPAEYIALKRGRVRLRVDATHGLWARATRAQKVVCVAGYDAGDAHDLEDAVYRWVTRSFQSRRRGDKQSLSQGRQNASFNPRKMPAEVKELLRGYRAPGAWMGGRRAD